MPSTETVDYLVVGAGSSGAVIANRLSAQPDRSVLLLEAGGLDERPEIHRVDAEAVLSLLTSAWSPTIDWGYATGPEKGLNGRTVPIARGKVLGGCSSVNALMWVRGNPADYDRWSREGNPGWSFDEVLPYFKRAETYTGPGSDSPLRGVEGPVQVRALDRPSPIAQAFVAATGELGRLTPDFDYNGPKQAGSGFFYQTIRTPENERCSTAVAYLRPVLDRPNLTVLTRAQATRLVVEDGRVVGAEYVRDGVAHTVAVRREVVLSAGAFESPKLLMLSGIGPAAHLAEHGIPLVADLPGVGQNLQDHLFMPVCYQCRQEHPDGALLSEAGLFVRTDVCGEDTPCADDVSSPDLQFTFGPIKFLPPTAPEELWDGPGFTFAPIAVLPHSRGEVLLRSSNPADNAEVRANYLQDERDLDVLVQGVKLARELTRTSAFAALRGAELLPGDDIVDEADLREAIRENVTTLWHPVGTCRMGTGPLSVVDAELRVRGVAGLRVADASIMPEIVAGNTHAPSVMIGEKAADLIANAQTSGGQP